MQLARRDLDGDVHDATIVDVHRGLQVGFATRRVSREQVTTCSNDRFWNQ